MNDLGDVIGWPTRDPGWMGKVVLTGLISLIPIVGQMVLLGWMLACLDNLRAGRQELPPAGFGYIGRGLSLFFVYLVYVVGLVVVMMVFFVAGGVLTSVGSNGQGSGPLAALGAIVLMLAWVVMIVFLLGLYLLLPAIVIQTERGGFGAGMNLGQVVAIARSNGSATLMAGLMTLLAYVIGGLGGFLCGIGAFLTVAYGYAMVAGIVRVYEQQVGGALAAPPLPPPYPPATPA